MSPAAPTPGTSPFSSPSPTPGASDVGRLFRAGRLTDAIAAANAAVRAKPSEPARRILLAELLLFAGNLDRADVVLNACSDLDPTLAVTAAEFRQLVRAETARRQLFSDGRVPEFLGGIEASQRASLAALVARREGNSAESGRLAAEAEAARPHPAGETAGMRFDDLRDGDDLLAGTFEVLTTTGKYFWVPIQRVTLLEFHHPRRPRDLYWRRASMQVADGPDGDVYLPAIYVGAAGETALTDMQRLGRETDWRPVGDGAPVRGIGAKTFLLGEGAVTLMEMTTLTFEAAR
jgi:type VI secretion system protein ImpE